MIIMIFFSLPRFLAPNVTAPCYIPGPDVWDSYPSYFGNYLKTILFSGSILGMSKPTFKPFCQASVQLTNNITTRQTKLKSLQLDLKLGSA